MAATTDVTAGATSGATSRVTGARPRAKGTPGSPATGAAVGRRILLAGTGAAGVAGAATLAGCAPLAPVASPATGVAAAAGGATAAGAAMGTVRVTIEVNKAALVSQLHAYLSDPHFSTNQHPVVEDWSSPKRLNLPRPLLEAMLLEGDLSPEDVETFVDGLLSGYENLVVR